MSIKKRILLKIGSNTLTKETNQLSRGKIEDIGRQIASLKDDYEFIIVSSGAIAAAKQFVKLESNGKEINVKQALASIGQPHLIRMYQESFRDLGLLTSQCLLSYSDFERQESKTNIVNTINVLVNNNYIPIINENDTVATDEIQFGDNDKLAALTASLLNADLFIIATNTNGIYTKASINNGTPSTIKEVSDIKMLSNEVMDLKSAHGTGGMQSKIDAISVAKQKNIETWIVNGLQDNFIVNAFNETIPFTRINNVQMKKYIDINDIENLSETIQKAIQLKKNPFQYSEIGKQKTLVMLFFNSSLRTRLSTEKAARNLGMSVMILNVNNAWNIEFEDGTVMNANTSEHIKEAAQVISQYADIIAVRAFPTLKDKHKDESEYILNSFVKYASVPVVNMESSTAHPLQALTDAITIEEIKSKQNPKVVLSWVPHPKALPHAVANSFVRMMQKLDVNFTITHPKGYELNPKITKQTPIYYNQEEALKDADFVYVKNWSSYSDYGKILTEDSNWIMTQKKLGNAKFMHCLPVRRNVVVEDAVLDSSNSLTIHQANNRTFAAQIVLQQILENL